MTRRLYVDSDDPEWVRHDCTGTYRRLTQFRQAINAVGFPPDSRYFRKNYLMSMCRYFLILICCAVCVAACKKSNPHTSNTCRISANNDTFYLATGDEMAATRVFYDNNGRIAYTKFKSGNDSSTRVFIYMDSILMITPNNSRSPYDTILLDPRGLIVQIKQVFHGDDYYDLITYSYDAAGQLQSTYHVQASLSGANRRTANTTYKFENGDCVSQTYTDANGTSTTNYTYYTDKPAADGDFQSFQSLANYGKVLIRNKHLLQASRSGTYVSEYSYTFDNSGKIATATYRFNNQVIKNTYEYDCSQ